jgi:hypothetical protein
MPRDERNKFTVNFKTQRLIFSLFAQPRGGQRELVIFHEQIEPLATTNTFTKPAHTPGSMQGAKRLATMTGIKIATILLIWSMRAWGAVGLVDGPTGPMSRQRSVYRYQGARKTMITEILRGGKSNEFEDGDTEAPKSTKAQSTTSIGTSIDSKGESGDDFYPKVQNGKGEEKGKGKEKGAKKSISETDPPVETPSVAPSRKEKRKRSQSESKKSTLKTIKSKGGSEKGKSKGKGSKGDKTMNPSYNAPASPDYSPVPSYDGESSDGEPSRPPISKFESSPVTRHHSWIS